jgi:transcription initiation factor TFIID TATA-box-binding protein
VSGPVTIPTKDFPGTPGGRSGFDPGECVYAAVPITKRILANKIVANLSREGFPGNIFTLDVIKIQNIVRNTHVPMQSDEVLDLQLFYNDFNIFCTYQSNMFPGLIYRPTSLPIVLLIFFSGKVVITGAKNMPDVYTDWMHMLQLLHKYTMKKSELSGNTKPKQFP